MGEVLLKDVVQEFDNLMLPYDPVPWLLAQNGRAAVRARRLLGLRREGDEAVVQALEQEAALAQQPDGSLDHSLFKTAGVLNLLNDMRAKKSGPVFDAGVSYLFSVLESQPGYEQAKMIRPGNLLTPCDLCGFFGPYEERSRPEVVDAGAREMNFYRIYEPLLGPKAPVRTVRRSSYDRVGPSSCYSWGLIPLCYTIETLCRARKIHDERLQPAINALLGAQRESGGWCRNLGGHPTCTIYAFRALGSHPVLRQSDQARQVLDFVRTNLKGWKGNRLFALLQATARFDLPAAHEIIQRAVDSLAPRQRKNGTFGTPCRVERVAAVLVALKPG